MTSRLDDWEINGRTDWRTDGWLDGWTDGRMDGWIDWLIVLLAGRLAFRFTKLLIDCLVSWSINSGIDWLVWRYWLTDRSIDPEIDSLIDGLICWTISWFVKQQGHESVPMNSLFCGKESNPNMYKFRILTIAWTLHNASKPERYYSLENLQLEL